MDASNELLLTTGQIAKDTGVTLRTLRYYDSIDLLKPSNKKNGRRLYDYQDLTKLQKILTLKFIGLSLDDIEAIIKNDINEDNFKNSLTIQNEVLQQKIYHMNLVKTAIDESLRAIETDKELNWEKITGIIRAINSESDWLSQYKNAASLQSRIKLHDTFSANKTGLHKWFFQEFLLPSKIKHPKILELGCGDGTLWKRNFKDIPPAWEITLSDISGGMIKDATQNLGEMSKRFIFKTIDAQDITFSDETFDIIIGNNFLYHVHNIKKAFYEIQRVLKRGGIFYASTTSKGHLNEIHQIVSSFDSSISIFEDDCAEKFGLENGHSQLSAYFNQIELKKYADCLLVTASEPLIEYIISIPGSPQKLLIGEKLKDFTAYINKLIKTTGGIFITKDTGIFKCVKQ